MEKRIIDSCVCILLCLVTLTSACQKSEVGVASVTLSQNSLIMRVGQTSSIRANVKPDDATGKTVVWTSSNTGVATVADGVITALKVGSATITAKAGDKSATCAVTVEATPVSDVTVDPTQVTLKAGQMATLSAIVSPDDATDKTVVLTSSNTEVATVADGVITALKVGSVTITAKAGDKSATCAVTVEATSVSDVTVDPTQVTLKVGQTATLSATVSPDNATDKTVVWTSSNTEVATVADGVITALKVGSVTITAKAGDKSAACAVAVENAAGGGMESTTEEDLDL